LALAAAPPDVCGVLRLAESMAAVSEATRRGNGASEPASEPQASQAVGHCSIMGAKEQRKSDRCKRKRSIRNRPAILISCGPSCGHPFFPFYESVIRLASWAGSRTLKVSHAVRFILVSTSRAVADCLGLICADVLNL
jgi:hypothetical protein